jgi:hypothetical protein
MKKYAIAYVSFMDNDCQLHFIEAENEIKAIKNFLVSICKTEESKQSQIAFNETFSDDIEEIKDELINCETGIDIKEIPV